jgi:peptide/nickel transport system substrate-binding protein
MRGKHWQARWVGALAAVALLVGACKGAEAPAQGPSAGGGGTSAAGGPAASDADKRGGEFRIAFPTTDAGDVRSLDPQIDGATYANTITAVLYDSLVFQDPSDNSIKPGLAERWEASDDGTVYTFYLKSGVKFHDGTPLTAAAVRFSYDRAVDPQYKPRNSYPTTLLSEYDHTEVVDDRTARIYLKHPQANFLQSVAARTYMGIVSPSAVERLGVDKFGEEPVGTGPFKFVEWIRGDRIVVERNPDYQWGSSIFHQGPAYLDRIVFRFIPEATTRGAALESGEVDAIDGVPEADQSRLESDSRFEVIKIRKNGSPGRIELNNREAPTNELAVRVAINQAIDRDAINRTIYYGVHVPTLNLIEEKMFAFDPQAKLPGYDPAKAKETLDRAGWVVGAGGIREKSGQPLRLKAIGWADQRLFEVVQSQLKAVGIDVTVEMMSRAAWTDRMRGGSGWQLSHGIPWGWTNEDPHLLFSHYHSSNMALSNENYVSIPEVDRLLEEGDRTLDTDRRKEVYFKAQEILAQQAVTVPIVSMYRNVVVKRGVHDVRPDVRGTYRYLHDVWIERNAR